MSSFVEILEQLFHMRVGRSLKGVELCNQLPITETLMAFMTDSSNLNVSMLVRVTVLRDAAVGQ